MGTLSRNSFDDNLSKNVSTDSVIYVATYDSSSLSENIPIIDLTESNSSICPSNYCISKGKNNYPKTEIEKIRNVCSKSLSLVNVLQISSKRGNISIIDSSVGNHEDGIRISSIKSSEQVWALKKSYPLTEHLQQIENIQSYHPLSKNRTNLTHHRSKIELHAKNPCQKFITASDPILHNDLEDIILYPLQIL